MAISEVFLSKWKKNSTEVLRWLESSDNDFNHEDLQEVLNLFAQ